MSPIPFKELAVCWKAEKRQYVKKTSYACYIHHLNRHLLPVFGDHETIRPDEIQDFANRMLEQGLSCKTVSRIYLSDGEEYEYTLSVGTPKTISSFRDIPSHQLWLRQPGRSINS